MEQLLREFSSFIHHNFYSEIPNDKWGFEVDDDNKSFRFGYKITHYRLMGKEKENDIFFTVKLYDDGFVEAYFANRTNYAATNYLKVFKLFKTFLKERNYDSFLIHENLSYSNFLPMLSERYSIAIGDKAKSVFALLEKMKDYVEVDPNRKDRFQPKTRFCNVSFQLRSDISAEPKLLVYFAKKKVGVIKSLDDLEKIKNRFDELSEKIQKVENEILNLVKKYDVHSYYKEETKNLFVFVKRIPFFIEIDKNKKYRCRLFYETFIEIDLDILKEKLIAHATDYLKKNRIKSVIEGRIFEPLHQFYFKVLDKHSSFASKSIENNITTTMKNEELLSLAEKVAKEEKIPLNKAHVRYFKYYLQSKRNKAEIIDAFTLGDLYIFVSKTKAFVEKKEDFYKIVGKHVKNRLYFSKPF